MGDTVPWSEPDADPMADIGQWIKRQSEQPGTRDTTAVLMLHPKMRAGLAEHLGGADKLQAAVDDLARAWGFNGCRIEDTNTAGYAFTDTGEHDEGAAGQMPDKEPGVHRWIAMAVYSLSSGQARMASVPGARVLLDHENRLSIMVGCADCEYSYELVVDKPCPVDFDKWSEPNPDDDRAPIDDAPAGPKLWRPGA